MPTEEQRSDRPPQVVPQGVLALMPPLKILAPSVGVALLVWVLLFVYVSSPAWAATITVNSTDDPGVDDAQCTLREAITSANTDTAFGGCVAGSGDDVINFDFALPETVSLTAELPALSSNMEIDGPGADQLTVRRDTGGDYRIFTVSGDTTVVTISGMTISNGNTPFSNGGGISNEDNGNLTVTDSTITDNSTGNRGGGIYNDTGTVTVTGSTISLNSASGGGGINNDTGTLTVTDSTISGNTAESGGGGISTLVEGSVTVTGSTISDNSALDGGDGGGIYNDRATLTVTDSTISGNTVTNAHDGGGGIFSSTDLSGHTTTIINSTISGNTVTGEDARGGGVYNQAGLTVIKFSTITKNTAPNDEGSGVASYGDDLTITRTEVLSTIISANTNTDVDFVNDTTNTFASNGYNLIGDGNATGAFNQTTDLPPGSDPKLAPLDSYGGPTQTHRLQADSPAIDAGPPTDGDPTACPPPDTDQRGVSRPQESACDIGSFELESQPALSINDITLTEGNSGTTTATFTVSLSKASAQTVTVNYATADGTATAGTDYQLTSGTLSFAPGQTTQSVRVQVNGEKVLEENESFFVNLSNPTNATISDAQGKGTITNDDSSPDTTAPTVKSTFPRDGGEVGPAANIRATFSEDMREASVINAFKLFKKGSTNQIDAVVSYDAATDTATLNPTNNLRRGATYKAVVSTVAKDTAGNRLDQNASRVGLQQKVWFFEIDN